MLNICRNAGPLAFLCLSALALVGCQTVAQRELAAVNARTEAGDAKSTACINKAAAKPEFAELARRVPLASDSSPSLVQLASTELASPEEVQELELWHTEIQPCREAWLDGLKDIPSLYSLQVQRYSARDAAAVEVIQGRMTWGEYLRLTAQQISATSAAWQAASDNYLSRFQRAHDAEIAYRRSMSTAFSASSARPMQTNCSQTGYVISCTSF